MSDMSQIPAIVSARVMGTSVDIRATQTRRLLSTRQNVPEGLIERFRHSA
jgi:hypothetical protein